MDKGTYVLVINFQENAKENGDMREKKEGKNFDSGYYLYVGRADDCLKTKIENHIKKNEKRGCRTHTYVNSILNEGEVEEIWTFETDKNIYSKISEILSKHYRRMIEKGENGCECTNDLFYVGLGDDLCEYSMMIDNMLENELNKN
ncbi:MAG: DUF123 domain-containing protein [Thermoplasmata archaeon]